MALKWRASSGMISVVGGGGGGGGVFGKPGAGGFRNHFPPKVARPPGGQGGDMTGGQMMGGGFGNDGGLGGGMGLMGGGLGAGCGFGGGAGQSKQAMPVADWARVVAKAGNLKDKRGQLQQDKKTKETKSAFDQARAALAKGLYQQTQAGQLGVDLSVESNQLKDQTRMALSAQRQAAGRTLLEIGGAWIDQGFDPKMPTVTIKAFSPAYFRLLERRPQLRDLLQLGNYLVWVTPAGTALVIDQAAGEEKWDEAKMAKLFKAKGPAQK